MDKYLGRDLGAEPSGGAYFYNTYHFRIHFEDLPAACD